MGWAISNRGIRWALCGVAGTAVAALVVTLALPRPAAADNGRLEEIKELAATFRGSHVDVYVEVEGHDARRPWVEGVKVIGSQKVAGKQFLRLKNDDSHWLMDVEKIVAFQIPVKAPK